MKSITQTGTQFSIVDMLTQKFTAANKKPRTFEQTVLDGVRQTDLKQADVLEKRLENGKQAVAQLRTGGSNAAQSKKAAAAEKVNRIKEQIKALKMMGGDPKAIARQIAQLARELASAAHEYTSAAAGGASAQDAADPAEASSGASSDKAVTLNVSPSGDPDAGAAASDETGEKDRQDVATTAPSGAILAEGARKYQEAQRQQFVDDLQKKIAELRQKSSAADADRDFAQEVRTLAAQLKALAKQQEQRMRRAGDHSADHDIAQIGQALAEAEKSVSGMAASSMAVTASVSVLA